MGNNHISKENGEPSHFQRKWGTISLPNISEESHLQRKGGRIRRILSVKKLNSFNEQFNVHA